MVGTEFGVHTVLAAGEGGFRAKPPFTGTLTVRDIEGIFDEQLGDMTTYSPWMDYNMALWAPAGTLDVYTSMLEEDGFSILRLSWACESAGGTCYSAIWHIPKSQVVVEIISNQTSEQSDKWHFVDERRHVFATGRAPSSPYMTPLHDSRAVSNLTELLTFYRDVFHLEAFDISEFSGNRIATFALPTDESFGHNATIQYVERSVKGGSLNLEHHSTAWFQEYLRSNAEKYMTEPTSCWPVWGDNHLAMFLNTDSYETSDDAVIDRLVTAGWTQYHPFVGMENVPSVWGHTVVYLLDPSGWQIEYHGGYRTPPNGTDVDVGDFNEYCDTHCVPDVAI